jgi:glycosidase
LGGVPSIYYGQELGMTGTNASLGATDANDIPNRAAFEWYKSDQGKGMAYWYKIKGPWRNTFNTDVPNDGISLEEEEHDPKSLWNFYREMIRLRKSNPEITRGTYQTLENDNDKVFSFCRSYRGKSIVVAVNLSPEQQQVKVQVSDDSKPVEVLFGSVQPVTQNNAIGLVLSPYGVQVLKQ